MKIILTGYSGFVGTSFLKYLSKNSFYKIYLLGRKKILNYNYQYWDLNKVKINNNFFEKTEIIFHFSSIAHTNESNKNKFYKKLYSLNYLGTIFLAKKIINKNVKKFVFISSIKSLDPDFRNLNIENLKNLKTKNIYGKIKRMTEIKLQEIFNNTDIKLYILRLPLVYGPNVKGNLFYIKNYISKFPIVLLPQINNKKSLIHIDNLIKSIEYLVISKNIQNTYFNLSDDNNYSFRQIADGINNSYNKFILYIPFPKYILKLLKYLNSKFQISIIDKLFADEIFEKNDLKEYGFKNNMKIENFNQTNL